MSRTLDLAFETHIAGNAHKLCSLLRLDLRDGTSLGVTNHDVDIVSDLIDDEINYSASTGMQISDVVQVAGMDAGNFEVTGPVADIFTRAGLLGGRFSAARARLVLVNWSDPSSMAPIIAGKVQPARVDGSRFTMEVRGTADAYNQTIGRVLAPYCTHDFGDAKCTVVRTPYPCEVTAVASSYQFTVDIGGDHPDRFFDVGSVAWLTGALAGIPEAEVFAYTGVSGAVELYVPLPQAPEVGDTLNLFRGCSKLRMSDDADLPTCLFWENVVNFGGFPDVPGSRQYLKTAIPGAPGA